MKAFNKLIPLLALLLAVSPLFADDSTSYQINDVRDFTQPVVAEEYYDFLCDSQAVQSEPSLTSLEQNFIGPEVSSIITCGGVPGNYRFSIDTARWNTLVSTVPSQDAQHLFNQWQQNPTIRELCSYIQGEKQQVSIASEEYDWRFIPNYYRSSVTLPQADRAVKRYGMSPIVGSSKYAYTFVNERGMVVFSAAPATQLLVLRNYCNNYYNNSSSDKHDYYHRPTVIELCGNGNTILFDK